MILYLWCRLRITLDIDDEILRAVKGLSTQQGRTLGQVVSDLIRGALKPRRATRNRNGVPIFQVKRGTSPVTLELVNELRDGD